MSCVISSVFIHLLSFAQLTTVLFCRYFRLGIRCNLHLRNPFCILALDGFDFSTVHELSSSRDSNPGPLGVKRKRYLCAMWLPFLNILIQILKSIASWNLKRNLWAFKKTFFLSFFLGRHFPNIQSNQKFFFLKKIFKKKKSKLKLTRFRRCLFSSEVKIFYCVKFPARIRLSTAQRSR